MKKLFRFALAGAIATSLLSCGSGKSQGTQESSEGASLPREKTLYLVGFQWGDPSSFNPLNDWPAWPVRPEFNLMYEPLTNYNSLTGEIEPLIGRLYEKNADYVSVFINPAAKWSDGKRLTAKDVKFSYEMGKKYGSLPTAYVEGFLGDVVIDTVNVLRTVSGDDTTYSVIGNNTAADSDASAVSGDTLERERVTLYVDKENRDNPLVLVDLLSAIPIYPEHIWAPKFKALNGGDVSEIQEEPMLKAEEHVVSGPYNLYAYSNEKIIIKRRETYWGNKVFYNGEEPRPEYIVHPIYKGNSHSSTALKNGELDISANFMPRIWLKKDKGVATWYDKSPYYIPGSTPMFILNTTKKPMDDKRFRRAMALAINYRKVTKLAASGYSPNINSGLILPFSDEKKYYSKEEVAKHGASRYNPEEAKKILKDAGYSTAGDINGDFRMVGPKGDTLPTIFIMCPTGWSDFEAVIKLAVKSMREVGIDAREGFVDETKYDPAQETGEFDVIMTTPAAKLSASMPWARFETVMSSSKWQPIGGKMRENIGRFNQPGTPEFIPEIDSLLIAIPRMSDEKELAEAYRTLNEIFMKEQPAIPVQYKPEEFYQFSTTHWTNFASEKNPYAPPHIPTAGAARKMLWNIESVQSNEGK